jgi:hypothetical protein
MKLEVGWRWADLRRVDGDLCPDAVSRSTTTDPWDKARDWTAAGGSTTSTIVPAVGGSTTTVSGSGYNKGRVGGGGG